MFTQEAAELMANFAHIVEEQQPVVEDRLPFPDYGQISSNYW